MSDLLNRLEARTMPSQDVVICLDLDLLSKRDEAMKAVASAQAAARVAARAEDERLVSAQLKESDAVVAAKARVAELEAAIRDASITLRIKGVDRLTYNAWLLACPPRKGKDVGPFDASKFFMHAAKHSAVYVDANGGEHPISDEEWAVIDKQLTDGEHDRIAQAVIHVNREAGRVDVTPFVSGSATTTDSFGISASPAR